MALILLSTAGTVLANEEVIDGLSERGSHPVVKMPVRQWVLKITAFADELEEGLEGLQWPQGTLAAQKSWIGRSEGTLVSFDTQQGPLEVFTTRADTLYGVTYVVLAPEHDKVAHLTTAAQQVEVDEYLAAVAGLSDLDRTVGSKTRQGPQGVFLGSYATHPITGEALPIWIADYVIGGYGTSAVMAVPAHDLRDFEFAKKYDLPIKYVIRPPDGDMSTTSTDSPYVQDGLLCNGGDAVNGLSSAAGREVICGMLQDNGKGRASVSYKLRDWTFSRQRFWGEPIPIYFPVELDDKNTDPRDASSKHTIRYDKPHPVSAEELPLALPSLTDFSPGSDPQGCLARAVDWRYFQREGQWFARETNTMPQV